MVSRNTITEKHCMKTAVNVTSFALWKWILFSQIKIELFHVWNFPEECVKAIEAR